MAAARGRRQEELVAISGALTWLANIVMAWMTQNIQRVLDAWHHAGTRRVAADQLRHMAPVHVQGINVRGVLQFPVARYRNRLILDAGDRTLVMAQRLVHQVVQVFAPDGVPLFMTDGFKDYATALLTHVGQWVQPSRQQAKGPVPKPCWMPLPPLLYAQVVKSYQRRRVVRVRHRVVFGTLAGVNRVLATTGWQINTAFSERVNLTIRQHVAAVGRRVMTLCTHEAGIRQQLALYHVYDNFCLPHASLRQPLPHPEPTNGTGSAKRWWPRTPAMAAGLTDHTWTLQEVLLSRVPPWP